MPSEITARKATLQLEEADAVALEKAVEPTPEEPATPAAPAAVEPKEETIVEDAPPPIAWDVAAIEKQLSDAASDSLHVSADDRATFIAFTLLGQDTSACPRITDKPEEFETELEDLTELLKAAVNCAARRPYEPPIQCIAAFLLQCEEEPELTEHLDEEEMAALMLAEALTSAPASAANKMLSVANALSRRGNKAPALHKRSPPSSPTRKEGGSVSFAAALGRRAARAINYRRAGQAVLEGSERGGRRSFSARRAATSSRPSSARCRSTRRAGRSVRSATRLWSGRSRGRSPQQRSRSKGKGWTTRRRRLRRWDGIRPRICTRLRESVKGCVRCVGGTERSFEL